LQTTYYPNLRYPNGQEVPVRPYKYTTSSLYGHSGHSHYDDTSDAGNKEYYSGNYFTGNYQPAYYWGYTNNYNYYYPEDIQLYEKRILDGIDIGFLVSVSTMVQHSLVAEPLIPKPLTGHDPEPVPSTSHAHNLFIKIHLTTTC
jgi:hypothetical protein